MCSILTAIFPSEPGLARCLLILLHLCRPCIPHDMLILFIPSLTQSYQQIHRTYSSVIIQNICSMPITVHNKNTAVNFETCSECNVQCKQNAFPLCTWCLKTANVVGTNSIQHLNDRHCHDIFNEIAWTLSPQQPRLPA